MVLPSCIDRWCTAAVYIRFIPSFPTRYGRSNMNACIPSMTCHSRFSWTALLFSSIHSYIKVFHHQMFTCIFAADEILYVVPDTAHTHERRKPIGKKKQRKEKKIKERKPKTRKQKNEKWKKERTEEKRQEKKRKDKTRRERKGRKR